MVVNMHYTATAAGSTVKEVQCESCGKDYVYRLEIQAYGEADSPLLLNNKGAAQRASERAEKKLSLALANEADEAPCPHCGWVQAHMFKAARAAHFNVLPVLLGFLLLLLDGGFLVFIVNVIASYDFRGSRTPYWAAFGLILLVALGLMLVPWIANRFWNPNKQPLETRLARAALTSQPKEEYLKELQQLQGDDQELLKKFQPKASEPRIDIKVDNGAV